MSTQDLRSPRLHLLWLLLLPWACTGSPQPNGDGGQHAGDGGTADRRTFTSEATPGTCPSYQAPVATGSLESELISESSGLLVSRTNLEVFWTHNDSGDTARLFAFNRQGRHLGIYTLQDVVAVDWEDLASGPGPVEGKQYLYVADIGDNSTSRTNIVVYRVAEPTVDAGQSAVTAALSPVETFLLQYPDGAHNAETLLVDPTNGNLYVVTKSTNGVSGVYLSASPQDTTGVRTLTKVVTLTFGSGALSSTGLLVTGGDISPEGGEVILRTYDAAVLWQRPAGASLAATMAGTPCLLEVAAEPQGESISFDAAKNYYTVSEGDHPSIYYFARR